MVSKSPFTTFSLLSPILTRGGRRGGSSLTCLAALELSWLRGRLAVQSHVTRDVIKNQTADVAHHSDAVAVS